VVVFTVRLLVAVEADDPLRPVSLIVTVEPDTEVTFPAAPPPNPLAPAAPGRRAPVGAPDGGDPVGAPDAAVPGRGPCAPPKPLTHEPLAVAALTTIVVAVIGEEADDDADEPLLDALSATTHEPTVTAEAVVGLVRVNAVEAL
jgi:hypothetical protein